MMMRNIAHAAAAAALVLSCAAAPAQGQHAHTSATDSAAVLHVIHQFHGALATGDSATVLRLLHDEAVILETGAIETKQEYRSHHLGSDIAFARAVPRETGPVRVTVHGDVAWATSTSIARGRYGDRDVNSQSAELVVLQRSGDGWVISAVHWSSRTLR
jgi:ketosteroid isomerase-like protein